MIVRLRCRISWRTVKTDCVWEYSRLIGSLLHQGHEHAVNVESLKVDAESAVKLLCRAGCDVTCQFVRGSVIGGVGRLSGEDALLLELYRDT